MEKRRLPITGCWNASAAIPISNAVLETGRTHQIRVHMASIGHPLLGDIVYGPKKCPYPKLEGQTLHAMILGFEHPSTGEYVETCAPLPEYFQHLLKIL